MPDLWNPGTRADLRTRVGRLTPDHPALWGRFTATAMLAHLNEALRLPIGDLVLPPKRSATRHPPLKQLVVYWLPIPRGVPTAAALLSVEPLPWSDRVARFARLLELFAAKPRSDRWPDHPMFGRLSPGAWGVLAGRHADHHLRQFGV